LGAEPSYEKKSRRGRIDTDPSFVVFSDDWGEHPSSCQHLFRHIARTHATVWVNTVGMREPRLTSTDFRKALQKLRKMALKDRSRAGGKEQTDELKLTVCQPPMLPLPRVPGVRLFNQVSVARTVRRKLTELRIERPILITTVPNGGDYVGTLGEKRVVYYCVDDFAQWPGLASSAVRAMEEDLLRKAEVFVTTSEKLSRRISLTGKPTHLLTHGVDMEHFAHRPVKEHPVLMGIPKPRVGYFGLMDERFDQELLLRVAEMLPNISFVITGRVEVDTHPLDTLPNVYFTGQVPYEALPSVVAGWSACLLPYVQNELTEAINPLKLKEYLATGKTVISTPLPEAKKLEPHATCCSGPEEWGKVLTSAIETGQRPIPDTLRTLLAQESWAAKAIIFLHFIGCSSEELRHCGEYGVAAGIKSTQNTGIKCPLS
jgi:hypothetical protein